MKFNKNNDNNMDNMLREMLLQKKVTGIDLSGQTLEGVDFSGCTLERVSFKKATLSGCRFRGAKISWCDFRYATVLNGTFEDAMIEFCDCYRAMFDGVIIFSGCRVSNTSVSKTFFGDCALLKRNNLVDGNILQMDAEAYEKFLVDWHEERTNDLDAVSAWDKRAVLQGRWAEAETIYKNFSAQWIGRGYISDGNWAYVRGRRMERKRMWTELTCKNMGLLRKMESCWGIVTNMLSDLLFGFGESMLKMVATYIMVVFLFAWGFYSNVSLLQYGEALGISLKNMVGMDSNLLHDVSPLVDMLNIVQTTIGIILTGIFGFILGNKIRNQ